MTNPLMEYGWSWRDFGAGLMLCTAGGGSKVVLCGGGPKGGSRGIKMLTRDAESGLLRPLSPNDGPARAIAAAPDMLKALERNRAALDLIDPMQPLQYASAMDLMRKDMDAAISAAKGPTP